MEIIKLENIKIEDTDLAIGVKKKIISNNIKTVGELKKYSVIGLFDLNDMFIQDIIHIKAVLNGDYNIHLVEEELVDYSDIEDEKRISLVKYCDLLLQEKRWYKKISKKRSSNPQLAMLYANREKTLGIMIINVLKEITELRNCDNDYICVK